MTIDEYFGDWKRVIDLREADSLLKELISMKRDKHILLCPSPKNTFKCFNLCSLSNLRVVIVGQDPYPNYLNNRPVATGLAFANSSDTLEKDYSPSLKVLRDSFIDFGSQSESINFDSSLESWERQGVLLLNTALSCQKDKVGSHTLLWRPFITLLLTNLSKVATGIVYVLMGSYAQSFESCINKDFNYVFKVNHPSYYARVHEDMPDIGYKINQILIGQNGYGIKWYNN